VFLKKISICFLYYASISFLLESQQNYEPSMLLHNNEWQKILKTMHHVALIPDGNRRWSREKGLDIFEGYKKVAFEQTPHLLRKIFESGVHTITLWAFSTENLQRTEAEVAYLMQVSYQFLYILLDIANDLQVKIIHLGNTEHIPQFVLDALKYVEHSTAHYTRHVLNFAFNYGGRDELIRAYKKLAHKEISPHELTYELFSNYLDTAEQPYPCPDIVIRTSGEQRLSNFMLCQMAYSELYFLKKYYPDFAFNDFVEVVFDFGKRQQRFGK
jgi:undecaprenyl diphosphate synthase